ncbi:MAG: primosomal protein N', partial [Burkholderiales bacterium]
MNIIRVALDVPVPRLFDYRAPDASAADVGRRVLVPFKRKNALGVIVELGHSTAVPAERLKEAVRILRDLPPLAAEDLRLLRFSADYYHHPLGAVIMGALPTRLRRVAALPRQRVMPHETAAGVPPAAAADPAPELTPEQARAVNEICSRLGAFRPFLLLGVTGSGKT